MPAETWAARASAKSMSSLVNGASMGPRSRCKTPTRLRGVRNSTHSTDDIVPSAMLRAPSNSGSSSMLQQSLQLIAGSGAFVRSEREAECFLPALITDRGNLHVLDGATAFILLAHVLQAIDNKGDVAEADNIVRPNGVVAGLQACAVDEG